MDAPAPTPHHGGLEVFTQGVRVQFALLLLFALETIHGGDQPLERLQVAVEPRGFAAAGPVVC